MQHHQGRGLVGRGKGKLGGGVLGGEGRMEGKEGRGARSPKPRRDDAPPRCAAVDILTKAREESVLHDRTPGLEPSRPAEAPQPGLLRAGAGRRRGREGGRRAAGLGSSRVPPPKRSGPLRREATGEEEKGGETQYSP